MPEGDIAVLSAVYIAQTNRYYKKEKKKVHVSTYMEVFSYYLYQLLVYVCYAETKKQEFISSTNFSCNL